MEKGIIVSVPVPGALGKQEDVSDLITEDRNGNPLTSKKAEEIRAKNPGSVILPPKTEVVTS